MATKEKTIAKINVQTGVKLLVMTDGQDAMLWTEGLTHDFGVGLTPDKIDELIAALQEAKRGVLEAE